MNRMRTFFVLGFVALMCATLFASSVSAASVSQVGFVESSLWFSPDSFTEGDTVRIYTGIWNGEDEGLTGTAHFYDKEVLVGKRAFTVPPGTLESVFVEWKASAGDHAFSVQIADARLAGGDAVVLGKMKSEATKKTVAKAPLNEASVISALESLEKSDAASRLDDQLGKAETFVAGVIPDKAMSVLGATFEPVEAFREERIGLMEEKKNEVKAELLRLEAEDEEVTEDDLDPTAAFDAGALYKPIRYIYLVFLGLLKFIYTHAIVFYAVLAYLAFVIIRFVYRKLFPRY